MEPLIACSSVRQDVASSSGAPAHGHVGAGAAPRRAGHSLGVTVPFNADPIAMDIPTHTYPRARVDGTYDYEKTVSLSALQRAFGSKFGGEMDLTRRVVQVHGIPAGAVLPPTVASLGTIPAQITIPLACGAITRIE